MTPDTGNLPPREEIRSPLEIIEELNRAEEAGASPDIVRGLEKEYDRALARRTRQEKAQRKKGGIFFGGSTPPALIGFITSHLLQMGVKYNVTPPFFYFTSVPEREIASFGGNVISFSDKIPGWWDRDPQETERLLKYVLAHEFRHYLTIARHIPLPRLPKLASLEDRAKAKELPSEEFAQALTGLSPVEARELWGWLEERAS